MLRQENGLVRRRLESLEQQVAKLSAALEEERRRGKRQAAPFRKQDQPSAEPKQPGRKSGRRHGPHAHRSVPPRIDETYDVPLPTHCPHCEWNAREPDAHRLAISDGDSAPVIYRRFKVHVGRCHNCHRTVAGRHALQTSTARGAAASQLGPNVHALLAICNKATRLVARQVCQAARNDVRGTARRPGDQHPLDPTHGPAVGRQTNRSGKTFETHRR